MLQFDDWHGIRVYTIGHSTRALDELVAMLRAFAVTVLVDIRSIPRSRHNPQFNADALAAALPAQGLEHAPIEALGGLRHARRDSVNMAWRNASFRGYADYLHSDGFEQGVAELHALAVADVPALMCAEAVPWRCHRSLVADVLTARGADVEHITGMARANRHRMTSFARVHDGCVSYPAPADEPGGAQQPG